jgi:GxxExxY protein
LQNLPGQRRVSAEFLDNSIGALPASLMVMAMTDDQIEALTETIIGCAIEVHKSLGPGLLESVYRECLVLELRGSRLGVEIDRRVPFDYKGQRIRSTLIVDLLVEKCIVVELKAVENLHPVHQAQVITYLKLSGCPAGLLLNFNATTLLGGLSRLDHPDRYAKKRSGSKVASKE